VVAPKLSSRGGRARSHGTRDSARAHLGREVSPRAEEHVTESEPTSVGRCGLKLQLAWQRVDARPAPCLNLELVCGVPGLQGADSTLGTTEADSTRLNRGSSIKRGSKRHT
jgi:hypothetical protein